MATIQEINSAIMFGNLTNVELNSIIDAVKFRRGQLTREVKRGLSVGDHVRFHSTKLNASIHGQVTKVAIKYVTVSTARGLWKVPANMLEAV